jgi:hypothetical protein
VSLGTHARNTTKYLDDGSAFGLGNSQPMALKHSGDNTISTAFSELLLRDPGWLRDNNLRIFNKSSQHSS